MTAIPPYVAVERERSIEEELSSLIPVVENLVDEHAAGVLRDALDKVRAANSFATRVAFILNWAPNVNTDAVKVRRVREELDAYRGKGPR